MAELPEQVAGVAREITAKKLNAKSGREVECLAGAVETIDRP